MKSTQCGVSEWCIVTTFTFAECGLSSFYVLPTGQIKSRFVANRIDKLMQWVPEYREKLTNDTNNLSLKIYSGESAILFVGSNSSADFTEFAADVATIDEMEECDQDNIKMTDERLSNSHYQIMRMIGNPKVDGAGISAAYDDSDRRRRQYKCVACNQWQPLEFLKNVCDEDGKPYRVVNGEPALVCAHCHGLELGKGLWVPEFTEQGLPRGYQISKLFSARVPFSKLVSKYIKGLTDDGVMQRFWNGDMGLPYRVRGSYVTPEMIRGCIGSDWQLKETCKEPTFIGLDPGSKIHYWIMDKDHKIIDVGWISGLSLTEGSERELEQIDELVKRYNIVCGVIDAAPEMRFVATLQARYRWMFRCSYLTGTSTAKTEEATEDLQKHRLLKPSRLFNLDLVFRNIRKKTYLFPKNIETIDNNDIVSHLTSPARVYNEAKEVYEWTKGAFRQDYFHALGYATMARNLWAYVNGHSNKPQEESDDDTNADS